jgi:GTP-binding protein HflX
LGVNTIEIKRTQLTVQQEKALLVGVELPERRWTAADPLEEIRGLAETAGARVVGCLTQRRPHPETATYLGKGKVEELALLAKAADADVIIFDNDLSPTQTRNIEKATEIKTLDRSELIMDIFASRARTTAARLQVELAQLEYSLPRLKNMWTHLSRYKGGIGLRGPGETQLEEDRRLVDLRIRDLKQKLKEVEARKLREVAQRKGEHTVSLVGYTNAGKSTLMNRLTDADVYVADKLFSTLDTRTRIWKIRNFGKVLLSDTVGFIRDLPHHLVASFRATLEEAHQARLLLHVVDASNPKLVANVQAVQEVLRELDCGVKPTILVLNKIDQVEDPGAVEALARDHREENVLQIIPISARTGRGLDQLEDAVIAALGEDSIPVELSVPAGDGKLLAFLSTHAEIFRQEYQDSQVLLRCHLPRRLLERFSHDGVKLRKL